LDLKSRNQTSGSRQFSANLFTLPPPLHYFLFCGPGCARNLAEGQNLVASRRFPAMIFYKLVQSLQSIP
jgi:hypothetical protein